MTDRVQSIRIFVAGLLAGLVLLGCNGLVPDGDADRRAADVEADAREVRDDPGLEAFARRSGARPHYFPMLITDESRFSIEIEEDLDDGGIAFAGYLRDIWRDDKGYWVVLSDAFGTHIVELQTDRDSLEEVLQSKHHASDSRYFVAAKIRRVNRPIVDVIREEEPVRVEGGEIVPPTVYRGSLSQIALAE